MPFSLKDATLAPDFEQESSILIHSLFLGKKERVFCFLSLCFSICIISVTFFIFILLLLLSLSFFNVSCYTRGFAKNSRSYRLLSRVISFQRLSWMQRTGWESRGRHAPEILYASEAIPFLLTDKAKAKLSPFDSRHHKFPIPPMLIKESE